MVYSLYMENEGNITVILEGRDRTFEYDALGLTYESTDAEIIEALVPIFEEEGVDLQSEFNNGGYIIKRSDNSHNIHLYPKSTAGEVTESTFLEEVDRINFTMKNLSAIREEEGRTEKARLLSIAITHLETAKLFVKASLDSE